MRRKRLSIEGLFWFTAIICFFFAAILLRPVALAFAILWLAITAAVIPLHFYKAWRRLATVPNRGEYAIWVLLETILAATAVAVFVYLAAVS